MTYTLAHSELVFACGSKVLAIIVLGFLRSQARKTKNDRKKSTTPPKAMIASDTRPCNSC
jgi:hypothetical protein